VTAIAVGSAATAGAALPGETGQIAFVRGGDVWAAGPDGVGEVQLTSGPEDDRWPRWSPEGNRIAVVRDGDLVLLHASGALLRVLTTHGDVVGAPSWSPDGTRLVYARGSGGIAVVEATMAGSDGTLLNLGASRSVAWNPIDADQIAYTDGLSVFTVQPDGSDVTEIVAPDIDGRTRDELAWSPQGQVVFTSTGPDGTRIEGAGVSLDGAAGNDSSPAWTPDGDTMLFVRAGTLHVYGPLGFGDNVNVRSLGVGGSMPDVQPALVSAAAAYETETGTALHFQIRPFGTTAVLVGYQTAAGAGSASEGTDYGGEVGQVLVEPFSNAVTALISIFGDSDPEQDETFFVDFTFPSDPAAPLRVRGTILNDDGGRNGVIVYSDVQGAFVLDPIRGTSELIVPGAYAAAFSPTGDRLAYVRAGASQLELVVADPSGVPLVIFPLTGVLHDRIVWSPDGARLAWTVVGPTLWVADPSDPSSATAMASDAAFPSWSADPGPAPRRLVFERTLSGRVCTIHEDGSGESCLTSGYRPSWSPDNTTIAFLRADVSVFLMNPDGSNERLAVTGTPNSLVSPVLRWSPSGGLFAFTSGSGVAIAQEGSPPSSPSGLPLGVEDFQWSPDGNQLVVHGFDPQFDRFLWQVGANDAGLPFASTRQVTGRIATAPPLATWSGVPARPTANLVSRGGIERFGYAHAEVELDAPSAETVTVDWETVDTGSATADTDYTPVMGAQVTLAPGETRASLIVPLLDDALEEGPESFDVRLTGVGGARPGDVAQVPVFITDDDGPPVAVNDVVATPVDTPVDIDVLANDRNPSGDPLALTAVGTPAHGTATFAGRIVTYTPPAGFGGVDSFLYSIADSAGRMATGAVSVYVGDQPLPPPPVLTVTPSFLDFGQVPLNKTKDLVLTVTNNTAAPVALAEHFFVDQADPRPFDISDLEGCGRVPILNPGESCTRRARFWSVPGADAASPATARLLDGVTFLTLATVPLFASVGPLDTGPNAPPIAVDDLSGVVGLPGFPFTLDALRNDSDPEDDLLRITSVSDPPHGTSAIVSCGAVFPLNPNADCIQYLPEDGYVGLDAIVYTISDGRGGTASATYHLAVGDVVPVIAAITPGSGPTAGGQAVRVIGSNFVYGSTVGFVCGGRNTFLAVTQLTDDEILATTPPELPGTCDLEVRTLFGLAGQLAGAYRYEDPPVARVRWINPLGGDWNVGANWETGVVPTATQDALIDIPIANPVTYAAGDLQINSLVSTQPMVFAAGTLTITRALTASAVSFTGGTLVTGGHQTYTGAVSVGAPTTLAADGSLVFSSTLSLGGGDLTLRAVEIDFTGGADSVSGPGRLSLWPGADGAPINVGGVSDAGAASLDLTDADLEALANGLDFISIGRPAGTHLLTVDASGAAFADAVILQAAGPGGSILVDGTLRTSRASTPDAAAVMLRGAGATTRLSADIVTAGGPITIDDAVILGAATVRLDTTNGGGAASGADVTITGSVDADGAGDARSLSIDAGAGDVSLAGPIGSAQPLHALAVTGADDVSLASVTTGDGGLIVATSGADPSVVLAGDVVTTAGAIPGNVTLTGPTTLEAGVSMAVAAPATLTSQDAFINRGTLRLAAGARAALTGPFVNASTGVVEVDIRGTAPSQFGRLETAGAANLDGALNVTLGGGFVPVDGDRFAIMTFGSRVGGFSTTTLPPGLSLDESDPTKLVVVDADATPSTTTATSSLNPSRAGQPVTFTATVAPAVGPGPAPQGTVRFDDATNGVALGTATLDAFGVGGLETSALAVGTHTIVATYLPGPGSPYAGSNASVIQVVEPASADLSIAATAAPDPVGAGTLLTYTVTVTNLGSDTAHSGQVSMPVGSTLAFVGSSPADACTGPAEGSPGTIVCAFGDLAAGLSQSVTIDARPSAAGSLASTLTASANETDPNPTNNAATVSVVVRLDPVVLVVPETIVVTDALTLTPSVMLSVPERIVVTDTPVVTPSVMLNVPEAIVVTDTPTMTPSVMLNVPETIVVSDAPTFPDTLPPTVTIDQAASQADPTLDSPIHFTVVFSEPVTGFDAGDVSFAGSTVGGTLVATVTGSGTSYTAAVTGMSGSDTGTVVATIPAGAAVDAAGNLSSASTSTDNTVLFEAVTTTTTLVSSRNPSLTTAPPIFTATVTSAVSGAAPTGQVEFLKNGVVFGTSALVERGGALVAVMGGASLAVTESSHTITARYLGDGGHQASSSAPVLQTVHPGTYYAEDVTGPASALAPVAFNDAGRIAGNLGSGLVSRAAVFDPVAGFRTLDNVSPFSEALDLNEAGTVVGRRGPDALATGGFTDRDGTLDSIPLSVSATGVNAREQVAINLENGNGAAVYDGTASTPLGLFEAHAINDGGVVVGSVLATDGQPEAILWQGGQLTSLGRFGQPFASATRVNNAGTVLVRAGDIFGPELPLLFRDGLVTGLGTGRAWDVNDADVAVVGGDEARVHVGGTALTLEVGPVTGMAINNRGEIVGSVSGQLKRWTPVPTSNLTVGDASGFEEDEVTLTARLTLFGGAPAAGRLITFSLNGRSVGSATTRPSGIAVLGGVSLSGLPIGVVPDGVRATYAGSPTLGASTATATLTVYAIDPADLVVRATASPAPFTVGSNMTFNVVLSNLGPSNAPVLRLNVALPDGLQYVSDSAAGACTFNGGLGTCDFDNFAAGTTRGIQIVARLLTGSPLTANFTVSGLRHDPDPANNQAAVTVDASPAVTINQAAGQSDPTSASPINFTVVFSEPVTGFEGSDLSFAGSTTGGALAATVTGSGASYTVSVTGMNLTGLVAVSIPAGAAVDSGGNPNRPSTSTDRTVFYTVSQATGLVAPSNGGWALFAVRNTGGQPTGFLFYGRPSPPPQPSVSLFATRITSFVIGGQTATFEGFDSNSRLFVATALDGGPGQPDRFRLWIEGVEQTAGGALASGSVTVQPWGPDTRLKGWVDLHTHPMSNLAFGGKLFHGAPSVGSIMPAIQMPSDPECRTNDPRAASIDEALSQDGPTRGDPLQSDCGDVGRNTVIKLIEAFNGAQVAPAGADGYGAFAYWPKWNDITHQKMWVDWIRRAHEYGQRVMVALSHNNRPLASLLGSGGPVSGVKDDKASSDLQVNEIKRMVADHSDFMGLATTPDELRTIVESGRLAIVLGVELDNLGNLNRDPRLSVRSEAERLITEEIDRLYGQGVRYVLPIHLIDNMFGDMAIYSDIYSLVNFSENLAPWSVGCAQVSDEVGFRTMSLPPELTPLVTALGVPAPPTAPICAGGPTGFTGHVNTRSTSGLTDLGEFAVTALMKRGMIVDIDHMSDRAANRTLAKADTVPGGGYPVTSGHTAIRSRGSSSFNAESSRTTTQLARIACLGGMFGLGTGETSGTRAVDWTVQYARGYDVMRRAFAPNGLCPQATPLGVGLIGLGTDTNSLVKTPRAPWFDPVQARLTPIYDASHPANAGVPALTQSSTGNKTWNYNYEGVAHYGMFVDFLRDVRTLPGVATVTGRQAVDDQMMYGADYFYRMWLKAETQKVRVP
jgi:uncharacterized repeat protein (TIGR01451 family)